MSEERIFIETLSSSEGFGHCVGFYTEGVGEYFCVWNGEKKPVTEAICNKCPYDKSISRQEAIEKMRKGFVSKYRGYFYSEPNHPSISDCLEAALDALLED